MDIFLRTPIQSRLCIDFSSTLILSWFLSGLQIYNLLNNKKPHVFIMYLCEIIFCFNFYVERFNYYFSRKFFQKYYLNGLILQKSKMYNLLIIESISGLFAYFQFKFIRYEEDLLLLWLIFSLFIFFSIHIFYASNSLNYSSYLTEWMSQIKTNIKSVFYFLFPNYNKQQSQAQINPSLIHKLK